MPIPKNNMGECLRFLRKDKPDMPMKQRIAICMSETGQSKKEPKKGA